MTLTPRPRPDPLTPEDLRRLQTVEVVFTGSMLAEWLEGGMGLTLKQGETAITLHAVIPVGVNQLTGSLMADLVFKETRRERRRRKEPRSHVNGT